MYTKAGFPLANFFARNDFSLLCKLNYSSKLVAAEISRTKGKSSFARESSLVENRPNSVISNVRKASFDKSCTFYILKRVEKGAYF